MNAMFRSATFKLTMWYLALVMTISLIFSFGLYRVATDELARGLHNETARIYTHFPVFDNDPWLRTSPDYDNGAHRILLRLVGINIIVLLGAGLASYWLARRTLEPIEEAHAQQQRFTADVSHELRTPLTALRMESEVALLNPQAGKTELRQTLTSNLEEVTKLEALINNLLRLSRLEVEELQQGFTSLDTARLIETALAQVQPLATERQVTITNKATSGITLAGDQESLIQLLVILLDNAIKYSPHKSTVSITTNQKDGQAIIRIIDKGIGIEPAQLEHVFDRFYRADSSRNKAGSEGFGLGLSIAKMIADIHHGTIDISSRVGQGTTVAVSLPVNPSNP